MRKLLALFTVVLVLTSILLARPGDDADKPQYTKGGELLRPENYREWIFLSSGLGMNYSPAPGNHDMFTNVFVPQWAYKEFLKSGNWPDKTTFVVEERASQSKGSINKHGNFQTDLMGMGVEVKSFSQGEYLLSNYCRITKVSVPRAILLQLNDN